LTEGGTTSPDGEGCVVLFGLVAFVDQPGDDVSVLDGEIVMRAVDVGGDDAGEVASVFLVVGAVHGVDESFGIGVSFVGGVGGSVVEHSFVDWIGGFVGEDAGGEHGDEFGDFVDAAVFHDVVVDESVFTVKFDLLGHVGKKTSDLRRQVNDMRGLVLLENGVGGFAVPQISVLGAQKDPGLGIFVLGIGGGGRFDVGFDGLADETGTSGHEDGGFANAIGVAFCHGLNGSVLDLGEK